VKVAVASGKGGPGGNAEAAIEALGMEIYVGAGDMTVKESYDAYRQGSLTRFADGTGGQL